MARVRAHSRTVRGKRQRVRPHARKLQPSRARRNVGRAYRSAKRNETRAEWMAFCKERALEYLDQGDTTNALASLCSDLRKHPDTANMAGFAVAAGMLHTSDVGAMRDFIDGFA